GIGIAGNLKKLDSFFKHAENMLNPGGRIIFDSTDVDYMYSEPDGSKLINLNSNYYGELTYTMQYRKITGNPFEWLYVDYDTMASIAVKNGFDHVRLATGKHYNYLVMLVKKS
ncbi:MAG: SAM-dependent methyltransferase, partial [Bacteroidales bacterium]